MKRGSLRDDLRALTTFGGGALDGDDDFEDGTSALDAVNTGATGIWKEDGEGIVNSAGGRGGGGAVRRSQLRIDTGMMAIDDDARYKGKKVSRKALRGMMEDSDDDEEEGAEGDDDDEDDEDERDRSQEEDEEEDDDEDEEDEESDGSPKQNGHYKGNLDDSDEENDSEDEDDDDDDEEDVSSEEGEEEADDGSDLEQEMKRIREDKKGMSVLFKKSRDEQRQKAELARHHRDMWNKLLEVRIFLQRLMGMSNRLPRNEAYAHYRKSDDQASTGFKDISSDLRLVLSNLISMRAQQAADLAEAHDDEQGAARHRKRQRLGATTAFKGPIGGSDDLWIASQEDYERCKEEWKEVLDAAHQRATLSVAVSKRFRVINQGLWHQIESSLADRSRALKRSHWTKAQAMEAKVIGQMRKEGAAAAAGEDEDEEVEQLDLEAFDDSELYQSLLKDYIQNVGPSGHLGRLAVNATSVRARRSKKKVDTKASKGRKLRYAVHPKLEHFMFPIPAPKAPMDIDRLFASLPGRLSTTTTSGGGGGENPAED